MIADNQCWCMELENSRTLSYQNWLEEPITSNLLELHRKFWRHNHWRHQWKRKIHDYSKNKISTSTKTNQLPKIKTGTNRTFQIAKTAHSAKNNCAACLCFIFIFDEIWVPGSWFQQSQLEADRSKRFPFQWWQFSKFGLTTLERDLRRCLLLNIQSSLESTW